LQWSDAAALNGTIITRTFKGNVQLARRPVTQLNSYVTLFSAVSIAQPSPLALVIYRAVYKRRR